MATATVTSGSGSNVGIQTLEHLLFKATSPRFVPHVQQENLFGMHIFVFKSEIM